MIEVSAVVGLILMNLQMEMTVPSEPNMISRCFSSILNMARTCMTNGWWTSTCLEVSARLRLRVGWVTVDRVLISADEGGFSTS